MKKNLRRIFILILIIAVSPFLNYLLIKLSAFGNIVSAPDEISKNIPAVVFGSGRNYANARLNYQFSGRVQTAVELWKQNPERQFILTGLYDGKHYDEAADLLKAMQMKGANPHNVILDHNGIDTFKSILNLKAMNRQGPFVFISQHEHLERALWLADVADIEATGLAAPGWPEGTPRWFYYREFGARVKARVESWGYYLNSI